MLHLLPHAASDVGLTLQPGTPQQRLQKPVNCRRDMNSVQFLLNPETTARRNQKKKTPSLPSQPCSQPSAARPAAKQQIHNRDNCCQHLLHSKRNCLHSGARLPGCGTRDSRQSLGFVQRTLVENQNFEYSYEFVWCGESRSVSKIMNSPRLAEYACFCTYDHFSSRRAADPRRVVASLVLRPQCAGSAAPKNPYCPPRSMYVSKYKTRWRACRQ